MKLCLGVAKAMVFRLEINIRYPYPFFDPKKRIRIMLTFKTDNGYPVFLYIFLYENAIFLYEIRVNGIVCSPELCAIF